MDLDDEELEATKKLHAKQNTDINFIKNFSNINISGIAKDLSINLSNMYNNPKSKTQKEYARKIRKEIEKRFINLYDSGFEEWFYVKQKRNTLQLR